MALQAVNRQAHRGHDPRLGRRVHDLLPDPVDVLTSFKSELDAIAMPPKFLFFNWTLENYAEVQQRSNYLNFAFNSIVLSIGANIVGLIIAVPAAWSMAFAPGKRTKDLLMWMLSTKMMPAVGVLVPIYLMFRNLRLLDSLFGIGLVLMLLNLPLLIWMLYTYFKEIPNDILEAARMDGASLINEIVYVLTPMAVPGIASTMLLADHPVVERGVLDPQPDDLQRRAVDLPSSPPTRRRKGSSGPSFRRPRRLPSRPFSFLAGSRRSNWSEA